MIASLLQNSYDSIKSLPTKWIRIEVWERGREAIISVTDSGHGIPPEIRDRIFHPFFTTKDVGKGIGLSLSIAQGIAGEHGGSLVLDSGSPHTRFVLRLPRQDFEDRATGAS